MIPEVETKVYNSIMGFEHGQRAALPDPANPVSIPVPVPMPASNATELPLDNQVSVSVPDTDMHSRVGCMLGSVSTSSAPNPIPGNNALAAPTAVDTMGQQTNQPPQRQQSPHPP